MYNEGQTMRVVLPAGMKQLELLSVKADSVVNTRSAAAQADRDLQARVHLQMLTAAHCGRRPVQLVDWMDLCARCEEVHVAAGLLVLGVGTQPVASLAQEVGYGSMQLEMYKLVSTAMVAGEHFQEATLAFFDLVLYSGPDGDVQARGPVVAIEPDDFLQTLR